ncbi:unnamed protein product [Phytomonas sp. EM1]|nr:unnamed protein product [Phytomonas sp. EM1]|eukprot:CCW63422.1 unnamed protein product [Phytomonas sp. isolate EM1]
MYKASLHLQKLIECYVSYSFDFSVCKLLPTSCVEGDSHRDNSSVAVYTAQQYLEHLPYLLQGSSDLRYNEISEEEKQFMLFLSSVLLRALNQHALRCCGETTSGSDATGKRSTFIVWMVLSIYSHFAQDAERRFPNWDRVENLKEAVLTSSLKARYRVLAEWVKKRYSQKRDDPAFAELLTLPKQAPQQPGVDPGMFGGFSSQVRDAEENEEEALWSEVETLFHGEKGELTDPLALDKDLFYHFFLDYIDPVLRRYPKQRPFACIVPFPPLQTKDSDAWSRECLEYAKCQFKVHPLSPEASILDAVVAATAYTLPCLKQARDFLEYWEERYTKWVSCQSGRHTAVDDIHLSAKEMQMSGESLPSQRSSIKFAMEYTSSLYQALTVAHGAVQLIPSSIHAEEIEGSAFSEVSSAPSHLCGSWLSAAAATFSSCVQRYRLLHSPRVCVVLPGLAIAAVEIVSAFLRSTGSCGRADVPFPDAITATGTMLVSPPSARQALVPPNPPFHSEGADWRTGDAPADRANVRVLSSTALHPSSCLILLRRLPEFTPPNGEGTLGDDPTLGQPARKSSGGCGAIPSLKMSDLAAVVGGVREGVVLILVEVHIGKREQRLMEGWGTGSRTVVVVGSIGEWGMSQLSLRWRTVPNTPYTEPSMLRCIRDGKAGVLLYPLDEMDVTVPHDENTKGFRKRMTLDVVERRTRWLVVIGECQSTDRMRPSRDVQVDRTFSMSAPIDDSESDTTSSASSESTATNSSGSSAQYSDDAMCKDSPPLPFSSHVVCSVVVGGAVDALQRSGLLMARVVRQHLVHRAVLPARLGGLLLTTDGRVELSVLDRVRQLRTTIFPFTDKPVGDVSDNIQPEAKVLFHARILEAMEAGLQSYLLLCVQHDLCLRIEEAWGWLNQVRMSDTANIMSDTNELHSDACAFTSANTVNTDDGADVAGEVYFTVRSAYLTIASCLDELCHTALLGSHPSTKASSRKRPTLGDLYFVPLIE